MKASEQRINFKMWHDKEEKPWWVLKGVLEFRKNGKNSSTQHDGDLQWNGTELLIKETIIY